MRLFLGVDGGSTKTHAVIGNASGEVLGQGFGGPSNYDAVGLKTTVASIRTAVQAARQASGVGDASLSHAFLGLAGVTTEDDRRTVTALAREAGVSGNVTVHHDCYAALYGATAGKPGIVLIAGTGSACFGVDTTGAETLVGGWGYFLGDEGSAFDVARRSLRAMVVAADGRGPQTGLVEAFKQYLGLKDDRELMRALYHNMGLQVTEVASLAPILFTTARQGDAVAQSIVREIVEELALHVRAIVGRLKFTQPFDVALIGGLFTGADEVAEGVRHRVETEHPKARVVWPRFNPAVGALLRAMELGGCTLHERILDTVEASLAAKRSTRTDVSV